MASSFGKPMCDHSLIQTTKHASRPSLLLKDYLMDDLSSCSSSGFKSFPRRQCCSTIAGFLLEKDLQLQRKRRNTLPRRPTSSSTISALQRASEGVINAIRSLPLSEKSAKTKKAATGLLCSSLSRKLLSRSFWRKTAKEEGSEGDPRCRRSFRELLMQERDKPTSLNEDTIFTAPSITTVSSGFGSNSWGESEFTFSSSAISSDCSTEIDLVQGPKHGAPHQHKIDGVSTGDWPNEKEQSSPVSVLDNCPFEHEEEIKSHLNYTTRSSLEGAEHKHMQKRRHFESVASLEPVVLEKRMAWSDLEDEPHNHSTKQCSVLVPIMCTQNGNNNNNNVRHDNTEENARDLLNLVKRSIPSNCLIMEAETNLLFDYFKQSIGENINDVDNSKKLHLCKVAEDWIRGEPQELYLGWEMQEGRRVYISEMDNNCGEWKNSDQEKQQLALELENEVFASLVNELVLDLITIC